MSTGSYIRESGFKYSLSLSGRDLILASIGPAAFRPDSDNLFDPPGFNNVNLQNGASYLDLLGMPGGTDPLLMDRLTDAFDAAYNLSGRAAAAAFEQMYGSYAAYANTGLRAAGGRFRSLLRGRNAVPAGSCGSGVWASGFGSREEQSGAENLSGYEWDAQGFALGYEHSFSNTLRIGFGAAYSKGGLELSALRYENTPDTVNFALYGVYADPSGFFAQGGIGYGHAWNEYGVDMLVGGGKSGKYGSDSLSASLELGYAAKLPGDFTFIPSIGVEYDRLRNNGWTESVSGNPALIANRFDAASDDSVALPFGLRFNKLFRFGADRSDGGGYAVPEVRAAFVYQADDSRPSIGAGYAGAPSSAPMVGVKQGRSSWRLGAGVAGRFNEQVDFRVDYDFDARSGFRGHTLLATVGMAF